MEMRRLVLNLVPLAQDRAQKVGGGSWLEEVPLSIFFFFFGGEKTEEMPVGGRLPAAGSRMWGGEKGGGSVAEITLSRASRLGMAFPL